MQTRLTAMTDPHKDKPVTEKNIVKLTITCVRVRYRGSYMSAQVLLNLKQQQSVFQHYRF